MRIRTTESIPLPALHRCLLDLIHQIILPSQTGRGRCWHRPPTRGSSLDMLYWKSALQCSSRQIKYLEIWTRSLMSRRIHTVPQSLEFTWTNCLKKAPVECQYWLACNICSCWIDASAFHYGQEKESPDILELEISDGQLNPFQKPVHSLLK